MAVPVRIPLNTLAIGFGLAGLADLWSTAVAALHWPTAIGTAFWIIAFWMRGSITADAIHGGYFLPTVAAGFVASTTAADVGYIALAIGLFAVGTFFWVVMFAVIFARLALRPALPGPLVPTLAIFLAPPAVAGGAWFAIDGHTMGTIPLALAALTILMVLLELALIPVYRKLAFSLGFWSFTFPLAAAARLAVGWLAILRFRGCEAIMIVVLALVTAVVLSIGIKSLLLVSRGRRLVAEQTMTSADDTAAT